jgi:DNA-binding PadR family transcriptional regulator
MVEVDKWLSGGFVCYLSVGTEAVVTDAELAILSLLFEKETYDHDLNKLIDERGMRRWTSIGASSMYYVLDKLDKQGLVRKVSEDRGRRLFQITPAGLGVLQTSVADLLATPRAFDKSFELGIANLHVLKPSQVTTALMGRQQDIHAQLGRLRETLARDEAALTFQQRALYTHRIKMLEAEDDWLTAFIEDWLRQAPPDPEPDLQPADIPRSKQVILPGDPDSIHKVDTKVAQPHQRYTERGLRTQIIPPRDDDDPTKE